MKDILFALLPYLDVEKTLTDSNYLITVIWVTLTQITFISLWIWLFFKLRSSKKSILNDIDSDFKYVKENKNLKESWCLYESHLFDYKGKKKTEDFAEDYFNNSVLDKSLNMRFWLSVPGVFVGIGILGTFAGLTLGISGFNLESSIEIQNSIKSLLGGIGTAFLTSLHGIGISIIFSLIEKFYFNKFNKLIIQFCLKLNRKYKLTRAEKDEIESEQQTMLFEKWETIFTEHQKDIQDKLTSYLTTKDKNGNDIKISNIQRDLLYESVEQTAALKSFSTDLAEIIIEKFEESTRNTLLPKFVEILSSLNNLDSGIKSFSSDAGKDIGAGVNQAIESLQRELKAVVIEFREAFSSGAMQQINKVVESLDESAIVMENIPGLLKKMLQEIKDSNNQELENRQQLIASEFDSTISKFKNSTDSIINNLNNMERVQKESANILLESTQKEADIRKELLTVEMNNIFSTFKNSFTTVADNLQKIENSQIEREQRLIGTVNDTLTDSILQINDLLNTQEKYKNNIESLLDSVSKTIDSGVVLSESFQDNIEIMEIVSKDLKRISQELNSGSTNLQDSTTRLKEINSSFGNDFRKLSEYNFKTFENMQQTYDKSIQTLAKLNQEYEMIQSELSTIFDEIDRGLKSYSQVTRDEINKTLLSFTNSLTEGARNLAGSIEDLNEFFEEISEKMKK